MPKKRYCEAKPVGWITS